MSCMTKPLKLLSALMLVVALGGVTIGTASADPDPQVVPTSEGKVRGTVADGIRTFQGIPYAAPPVGERRWRAPQPARSWPGVRDATEPGAICPQLGYLTGGPPVVGSEDCLFLNVWTPARQSGIARPVLVFVPGGGFTAGAGSLYDPSKLVERGNMVVTLNYRLGVFGFLDHPGLSDPFAGNFGLADQQAALRWIRRNAAAFGGDASNVTLWGESAGAFSTCAQLVAPAARGLFQKAIVQSGPCANEFVTRPVAQKRGLATAAELGCPDPRSAVECLRNKPVQELAGLSEDRVAVHRHIADLPWFPVAGTSAIPLQPIVAQRLGLAANVPIMHGGTKDEMRSFVGSKYDDSGHPVTPAEYPAIVRNLYGARDARKVVAEYPLRNYPTPSLALAQLLTDEGRMLGACSQLRANDLMARWAPVYAFEFAEPRDTLPGEFPYGAHHGIDLQYFFDSTSPGPWTPPPLTGARKDLAEKLLDQWSAFARTGDPGAGWSSYRRGTVLSINASRTAPINLSGEHSCGFWQFL
jgi:para-nitrobenzyl esterase